ncbi:MAG: metal-dependent transcriptional regulator [Pseudonocardiaceae bacterium]|nr:metal-dependent transcriptional regulator [Pseudonocardiaceae bacterium]
MFGAPKWRSSSVEDYLKVIYALRERGAEVITPSALAGRLAVSLSSASGMIRKLADLGLVEHARYGDITLTQPGRRIALEVLRRHRLIELYLVKELDYSWDEVHDEAELLEHTISDTLLDRIAAKLGHPVVDPHGDPIPASDGSIPVATAQPLATLDPPASGQIVRVVDSDPELLRYLTDQQIGLGDRISVLERKPFGGPLMVRVGSPPDEVTHGFGDVLAESVYVEVDR